MLSNRLNIIRNLLINNKEVLVNDLCERFQISAVTIRKDLAILEKEGIAERFYGGAVLAENAFKIYNNAPEIDTHHLLVEKACEQIQDGDNIFLGSGRTCCQLAKRLNQFQNLSVVTNNITALGDLLKFSARVYLLGGEVTSTDGITMFSSPENPDTYTDNIFVSKAFTSISGIDLQAGLTVHSVVSTYIYRNLPSITKTWYVMADSTKFDKIGMYPVASLSQIDHLITDHMPNIYFDTFNELGVAIDLINSENI